MKKLLVVIDMQNDFVDGALGSKEARAIVSMVKEKVEAYRRCGERILFTRDTHKEDYLDTQEGRRLPIVHCVAGTKGHAIIEELNTQGYEIMDKPTFGSFQLGERIEEFVQEIDEIELCGLCSDICVVSNALILKTRFPEMLITVSAKCCAGVTPQSHLAALTTMKMCQVNVTDDEDV